MAQDRRHLGRLPYKRCRDEDLRHSAGVHAFHVISWPKQAQKQALRALETHVELLPQA